MPSQSDIPRVSSPQWCLLWSPYLCTLEHCPVAFSLKRLFTDVLSDTLFNILTVTIQASHSSKITRETAVTCYSVNGNARCCDDISWRKNCMLYIKQSEVGAERVETNAPKSLWETRPKSIYKNMQIYCCINSVASYMFRPPVVAIFREAFFEGYVVVWV
jgi:hypothetical protein